MRKIPTLFVRLFDERNRAIFPVTREVSKGCEWVIEGEGIATRKWDGTCCMVKDGVLYARYDYKQGRELPAGAIPCQAAPDEITGHFPHWVEVSTDSAMYKWHIAAFEKQRGLPDGTYELCGKHFQNNADGLCEDGDILIPHGKEIIAVERTYDGLQEYLSAHMIEGIVFHRGNGDMCKIKRTDFSLPWGSHK